MLFAPGIRAALATRLEALVREHHAANPLSEGLAREEARERLFAHAAPACSTVCWPTCRTAGTVVGRERLSGAGQSLSLSPREVEAREALERDLRNGGARSRLTPSPSPRRTVLRRTVVERMIALLVRQKVAVKIDGLYFHQATLDRAEEEMRALKKTDPAPRVDVASFKERYGITRKFAIPLLE